MGIEIQPPVADREYFAATFHIDINAMSPEALFDRLETTYRDFEHFKQIVSVYEHGGDVTDSLYYLAQKYFGAKLNYLFDEEYFNDFPTMKSGAYEPNCLADCCNGIVFLNQPNNDYYETPINFQVVSDNVYMVNTDVGMEYHTLFTFTLYFWNGGSSGPKKETKGA